MLHIINDKKIYSRKHGFSLIETVIGMALLLIVIVIVYQGFTSTIQLSANTAKFEANGDIQAGLVSNKIAAAQIFASPSPTPGAYLHLAGGSFSKDIGIFVYSPPIDETDTIYSTHRTGFWYIGESVTP